MFFIFNYLSFLVSSSFKIIQNACKICLQFFRTKIEVQSSCTKVFKYTTFNVILLCKKILFHRLFMVHSWLIIHCFMKYLSLFLYIWQNKNARCLCHGQNDNLHHDFFFKHFLFHAPQIIYKMYIFSFCFLRMPCVRRLINSISRSIRPYPTTLLTIFMNCTKYFFFYETGKKISLYFRIP